MKGGGAWASVMGRLGLLQTGATGRDEGPGVIYERDQDEFKDKARGTTTGHQRGTREKATADHYASPAGGPGPSRPSRHIHIHIRLGVTHTTQATRPVPTVQQTVPGTSWETGPWRPPVH